MYTITLRFKTDDEALIQNLFTSWTEDEGVVISSAGRSDAIDLTYVRQSGRDE